MKPWLDHVVRTLINYWWIASVVRTPIFFVLFLLYSFKKVSPCIGCWYDQITQPTLEFLASFPTSKDQKVKLRKWLAWAKLQVQAQNSNPHSSWGLQNKPDHERDGKCKSTHIWFFPLSFFPPITHYLLLNDLTLASN